jgi:hypothetical protein
MTDAAIIIDPIIIATEVFTIKAYQTPNQVSRFCNKML